MNIVATNGTPRNNQVGDYFKVGDQYHFVIKDTGNDDYDRLIFLHEFIEQWMTERDGIHEPDINAFDEAHSDVEEPGILPESPYRSQHIFAELIERLVADKLGIDFKQYEESL